MTAEGQATAATAARPARPGRRRAWLGAAVVAAIAVALGALWFATPLRSLISADALAAAGARLRGSPLALPWVVAAFVAGALVFDWAAGLFYGLVASTVAAWVTYLVGMAVRRWRSRWLASPRVQALGARLQRSALVTAFIARTLPVGSFTLFNIAAGAMRIPLVPYLVGSALGLLPRMIAFALVAGGVGRAAREPRAGNWIALGLAVASSLLALLWLRRRAARVTSARAP